MSITASISKGYLIPVVDLFPSMFSLIKLVLANDNELRKSEIESATSAASWTDLYLALGQCTVNLAIVNMIEPTMNKLGFNSEECSDVEDTEAQADNFGLGDWRVVSFHQDLHTHGMGYFGIDHFLEPLVAFTESALYIVQRIEKTVVKVPTTPCLRLLLSSGLHQIPEANWAYFSN